jgi:hypothetical protein
MAITLSTPVISSYITGIKITPYVNGVVGSDSFYASKVVKGAALAQADDTRTNIDSETEDSPIFIAVTKGEKTFTLNVADLQPTLLTQYFGATQSTTYVYMPPAVSTIYAQLDIYFKEGFESLTFPKVQMNAKMVGESLKDGVLQAQLVCTALVGTLSGMTTDVIFNTRTSTVGAVTLRTVAYANQITGGFTAVCELVDLPTDTAISGGTNTIGIVHDNEASVTYASGTAVAATVAPTVAGIYTAAVTSLTTGTYYFRAAAKCTPSGGSQILVYGEELSIAITGA